MNRLLEEIKREIKKFLEMNAMKAWWLKPMGCSKSCSKREAYSNTILKKQENKKQEKHQVDNLILHLKQLGKNKTPQG